MRKTLLFALITLTADIAYAAHKNVEIVTHRTSSSPVSPSIVVETDYVVGRFRFK